MPYHPEPGDTAEDRIDALLGDIELAKAERDAFRTLLNAKPRVVWHRGEPPAGGMYLVLLKEGDHIGEMTVTHWNDGKGKNADTWGDPSEIGWHSLKGSAAVVTAWISATDLKTLPIVKLN